MIDEISLSMRCGNQETCEDYSSYLEKTKKSKENGIIVNITGVSPPLYLCKACSTGCSTLMMVNTLEMISSQKDIKSIHYKVSEESK